MRVLRSRRGRARSRRFVAEGIRVVEDLVASDLTIAWVVSATSLADGERGAALIEEIDRCGIRRVVVTDRDFATLAATEAPQGVLAVADIPSVDFDAVVPPEAAGVVLVLDAVQDPGNFGTLVRSAEALGVMGVIALSGTVDPWNPKAVRSAAGSSFRVPILQSEWADAEPLLRTGGFELLGAEAGGGEVSGDRGERVALIVGNEGGGLSPHVRESVDRLVGVRLRGRAESLNVASAAAILLYELL